MEAAFEKYLKTVFEHPEIISARIRDITSTVKTEGVPQNAHLRPGFMTAAVTSIYP